MRDLTKNRPKHLKKVTKTSNIIGNQINFWLQFYK
jgi:hypothetical protein